MYVYRTATNDKSVYLFIMGVLHRLRPIERISLQAAMSVLLMSAYYAYECSNQLSYI
jgi:hypothetical protein